MKFEDVKKGDILKSTLKFSSGRDIISIDLISSVSKNKLHIETGYISRKLFDMWNSVELIKGKTLSEAREELDYQQRLAVVLEKFDKKYNGFVALEIGTDIQIEYAIKTKEFSLLNGDFNLSLDTVEHLIADIQGNKDE